MADRSHDPNSDEADGPPGMPRWVKAFGIVAIVLILLVAFILFTGLGGPHGPQRHGPSGDVDGYRASTAIDEAGIWSAAASGLPDTNF